MTWKEIPIKSSICFIQCFVLAAVLSLTGCGNNNESDQPIVERHRTFAHRSRLI